MLDGRAATSGNFNNKTTSIIPLSQLRRMRNSSCEIQDNHTMIEKQDLHAKSQERVKKWPCAMNIRRRKNQSQFERFAEDEEERRRIEKEEAEYQQKQKQDVLLRANRLIYENNPFIRQFQQKLLFSDVLQERDSQLQLNEYKKTMNNVRDKLYNEEQLEIMANYDQTEKLKEEELKRKKQEQKNVLKQQHDEMINNHIKQMQNEKIEGQLIKARAQKLIQEEEEAEKERKRKRYENMLEIKKGNEEIKEYKLQQLQKDKEQEEQIKLHGEKKDRILEMRKQREQIKFKEKQEQRQKLIDAQIAILMKKEAEQLQLMNKQIKEAEQKDEEVEKLKLIKQEAQKKKIEDSRNIIKEFKLKDKIIKNQNDKEFQQYWKQRGEELQKIEQEDLDNQRKRNQSVKDYQLQQIEQKQKIKEQQILQELQQDEDIKRQQHLENKTFFTWAERAVKEWADQGKNIRPLIKELAKLKEI
ncbi:unnamed protein product [Paramecium primaurelia]|uniref:Trichohyalin-plectin-homology domain-containing protein n=1 Tax=Paramecium primaurelia TaxID=5886 RepID=A0A8S1QDS5_PARPR|nr:unnamed protein product [Paramecium primaurelia]